MHHGQPSPLDAFSSASFFLFSFPSPSSPPMAPTSVRLPSSSARSAPPPTRTRSSDPPSRALRSKCKCSISASSSVTIRVSLNPYPSRPATSSTSNRAATARILPSLRTHIYIPPPFSSSHPVPRPRGRLRWTSFPRARKLTRNRRPRTHPLDPAHTFANLQLVQAPALVSNAISICDHTSRPLVALHSVRFQLHHSTATAVPLHRTQNQSCSVIRRPYGRYLKAPEASHFMPTLRI
ncbi:hypothetical protein BC834DRAFT_549091 [Gloeopeniophorella convolvens]|nr:hypothetical protein BC834DRAFT_549091 [Gloeopeniophorella convolvens]